MGQRRRQDSKVKLLVPSSSTDRLALAYWLVSELHSFGEAPQKDDCTFAP